MKMYVWAAQKVDNFERVEGLNSMSQLRSWLHEQLRNWRRQSFCCTELPIYSSYTQHRTASGARMTTNMP